MLILGLPLEGAKPDKFVLRFLIDTSTFALTLNTLKLTDIFFTLNPFLFLTFLNTPTESVTATESDTPINSGGSSLGEADGDMLKLIEALKEGDKLGDSEALGDTDDDID